MKTESALTRITKLQEMFHEEDKKKEPERHWLTKDSYSIEEAAYMCTWCADHYEWDKQFEFDARTRTFYKIKS